MIKRKTTEASAWSARTNVVRGEDSFRRPQPLYQQVKDHILERIRSGQFGTNARVPSENELVESLGVSRMTVHRALRELTSEGRLVRLQGVGTFVAERKPQAALLEVRSIADEIAEWGGTHSCDILLLDEENADAETAAAMELPFGAKVFHSIMVHRDSGRPVQHSDRYVNPRIAPEYLEQDFSRMTPSQYLLDLAPVQEAEHIIEAIIPDESIRRLLEIEPGEPCLLMHRRTWSFGLVATKTRLIYPGSRYRLGGRIRSGS